MAKGKSTCKILKEIRKQIAEDNDIELITSECTYQGDCEGTCPKCEAEVRYLERELEKRQRMGKAAVFAGMSLGTLFAATGCTHVIQPLAGAPMKPDSIEAVQWEKEPLAGDVVATEPVVPFEDPDTIVERPLMGIVRIFNSNLSFDAEEYKKYLKDLFATQEMEKLSIIGGNFYFEDVDDAKVFRHLEELAAETKELRAPSYPGGEAKLMEDVRAALKNAAVVSNYSGEMQVAFTVTQSGVTHDVEMVKGINDAADAVVLSSFERMVWNPAVFELKDGTMNPFDCRCLKTLKF